MGVVCARPYCFTLRIVRLDYVADRALMVDCPCRQSSISSDGLGDIPTKDSSNLLNHHKLRTSHSERDLPNLIPSHPDGGDSSLYLLAQLCCICGLAVVPNPVD